MPLFSFFDPSAPQEEFFSRSFLESISSHLGPAMAPFGLGAVLAVALVPVAILASRRLGMVVAPGGERRIHKRPTPVLGGLAIYLAFAGSVTWSLGPARLGGVLVVGGLAALIFALDDRFEMPARLKLALEIGLSILAILVVRDAIHYLNLPGLGKVDFGWAVAFPLTLFWLLGMQNTVNLLDGVDGLAGGVVAIVALVLMIAAAGRGDQPQVVVATAALAGCCVGFLVFNFHPARIFMGDSGSHFAGLTLGLLSILGVAKAAVAFALLIPVLALGIPIADTAWAIVRRRRQGLSIAHPDSRHIHHQLLDFGLSQRETCLLFYGGTAILGAIGLMVFGHKRILAVVIVFLFVLVSTVLGARLQGSQRRVLGHALRRLLS